MTKVMLIAGVAALAIAAPAAAGPHGHGGGGGGPHGGGGHAFAMPQQNHSGGPRMQAPRGHGGGFSAPRMQARSQPRQQFNVQRERGLPNFAVQRQRGEQRQARAMQMRSEQRQARAVQMRSQQRQAHAMQRRDQMREAHAFQARRQQQAQMAERRNAQQQARMFQRQQQIRQDRQQQRAFADNRMMQMQRVQQMRALARDNRDNRFASRQFANTDFASRYGNRRGFMDGCPPGLAAKHNGCMPPGQAMKLLGSPLSRAVAYGSLAALPESLRYMYPDTADRYYRYGDGYLYGVNRNTDVIDSLLPLVAGGYLPGMTLPAAYMNSYVPDYYGMNSFYPDTDYADYRYFDGNVYSVDPYSNVIQGVIPTYAYGYGVGQMLPASYGYYNVPYQYRSVYYDTPDYNYWYAPGAIYQVDPQSQLITSVASLLGPGMVVGQPLPMGYATYNVPMAYRSTYYDTPNAWYRYNSGYIYQVDPTTQLVTAIVASLLT